MFNKIAEGPNLPTDYNIRPAIIDEKCITIKIFVESLALRRRIFKTYFLNFLNNILLFSGERAMQICYLKSKIMFFSLFLYPIYK